MRLREAGAELKDNRGRGEEYGKKTEWENGRGKYRGEVRKGREVERGDGERYGGNQGGSREGRRYEMREAAKER